MQFKFELPKECLKHDKEMSYYNHNYYHIDFSILGNDIFSYSAYNVLYQEYVDDTVAYYTLGYFKSNEKDKMFIPYFTWKDKYYFIN